MAFDWDKLSKAQREYPKPKFALSYIDKLLKKDPRNPYLTSWRADVSLQLQSQPEAVIQSLRDVCQHKATLQDEQLLEYTYRLIAAATLRSNPKLSHVSSVGNEGIKAWQNAAALKTTKKGRKGVWDALFTTAMRQRCWEDVRTAVVKYRAEAASSDKVSYYTQIFAQQMSAEQKVRQSQATGTVDRMAEIQLSVALKQIKDAYERPENDPISIKDIRDLRFMASIYARQGKCAELLELWKAPPAHLQPIMEKHAHDISLLTVDITASTQQHEILEKHILNLIENAITSMGNDDLEPLRQLCSARVNVWTYLIDASKKLYSPEQSKTKISSIKNRIFGSDKMKLDRPLILVCLLLRNYLDESLLQDCKGFWKRFSRIPSCFTDLRCAVEKMSGTERTDFLKYIEEDITTTKPSAEDLQSKHEDWARAETCVLKFTYLITVSLPASQPSPEILESLVERALKVRQVLPKDPDSIMLTAYCLTNMHHQDVKSSDAANKASHALLQAAMLVRAAVEQDTEKENRTLALLAARLHLSLGLGGIAFQLWKHVKVKEMLVDTMSPYLLSRIGQTHPFDVKHHQGFSADKELKNVVNTIDKMSEVQESCIFREINRFHWDSAIELISMNEKLTSSLTRHTSVLERRRIARLKGELMGDLPDVDYGGTQIVSDNIDRSVFPAYEHSSAHRPYPFLMPADILSVDDLLTQGYNRESVSRILYRDGLPTNWTPIAAPKDTTNETSIERLINEAFWYPISNLLYSTLNPDAKVDPSSFSTLTANLKQLRQDQEKLILTALPGRYAVHKLTVIHENMLISSYAALEVLRVLPRLANEIREKVVQSKTPHPLKSLVPKEWAKQIEAEVKDAYEAIGKVAKSRIDLLQKSGVVIIKAQVRYGATGESSKGMLRDEVVESYAKEYVDSAVEAWKGVLMVKLK